MPECPMCHHVFQESQLICKRCGHRWLQRNIKLPKVCPSCKSPYWNRERRNKKISDIYENK